MCRYFGILAFWHLAFCHSTICFISRAKVETQPPLLSSTLQNFCSSFYLSDKLECLLLSSLIFAGKFTLRWDSWLALVCILMSKLVPSEIKYCLLIAVGVYGNSLSIVLKMTRGASTVVEHSPHHPKVEGLNPATAGSGGENGHWSCMHIFYVYVCI